MFQSQNNLSVPFNLFPTGSFITFHFNTFTQFMSYLMLHLLFHLIIHSLAKLLLVFTKHTVGVLLDLFLFFVHISLLCQHSESLMSWLGWVKHVYFPEELLVLIFMTLIPQWSLVSSCWENVLSVSSSASHTADFGRGWTASVWAWQILRVWRLNTGNNVIFWYGVNGLKITENVEQI